MVFRERSECLLKPKPDLVPSSSDSHGRRPRPRSGLVSKGKRHELRFEIPSFPSLGRAQINLGHYKLKYDIDQIMQGFGPVVCRYHLLDFSL